MKVETKVVDSKNVVVIEQANPQVIYVPSYNPTVIWGASPVYAYPPVYYPPAGYYAAGMALSFGVGVAMGAMWGGGWGYNCGWGGNNNININNNNNFNRNSNRTNVGNGNRGNGNWQHNPAHRGGAPYGDRATARQYRRYRARRFSGQPAGKRPSKQWGSSKQWGASKQPERPREQAPPTGQLAAATVSAEGRVAECPPAPIEAMRVEIASGIGRLGTAVVPAVRTPSAAEALALVGARQGPPVREDPPASAEAAGAPAAAAVVAVAGGNKRLDISGTGKRR